MVRALRTFRECATQRCRLATSFELAKAARSISRGLKLRHELLHALHVDNVRVCVNAFVAVKTLAAFIYLAAPGTSNAQPITSHLAVHS